jgi:hypothetical protein
MALMTISRKREFQSRPHDISASFVRNLMKCNGFGRIDEQSVKNGAPPRLRSRQRLQALEGQALGVPDSGEIEVANEGCDRFGVAIGQRNHGIDGNSLGVHIVSSGFLMRPQATARF